MPFGMEKLGMGGGSVRGNGIQAVLVPSGSNFNFPFLAPPPAVVEGMEMDGWAMTRGRVLRSERLATFP